MPSTEAGISVEMNLFSAFNWTFEVPWQAPVPKQEETVFSLKAKVTTALVILGVILVFGLGIYFVTSKAQTESVARFSSPEFQTAGSVTRRQFKRRKTKKARKARLTKTERLQEVNRRWYEVYGSDNSDCEDLEDLATVPFGTVEITEVKKVSFRENIKDVYFIESKEEMRRLEQLHRMGFDVTIARRQSSVSAHEALATMANWDDKDLELASTPLLCPSFDSSILEEDEEGTVGSQSMLRKWLKSEGFETENSKTSSDESRLMSEDHDERLLLLNIPLLSKTCL